MYSLVVPVYKNEESVGELLEVIEAISSDLDGPLETVFVVDGSPDRSYQALVEGLPASNFTARIIVLSRNFGSFSAIRAGLEYATGEYFAVMAADLQEPPELISEFFGSLRAEPVDLVVGVRTGRNDRLLSRLTSRLFWGLYRGLVLREVPSGGVDVFGCTRTIRDHLLALTESRSSLVAQLLWLGFRRKDVPYERRPRKHGRSAWTLRKKLNYLADSVFAFTDLPIRLLTGVGTLGLLVSAGVGALTLVARALQWFEVPGYTATVLLILFFGSLNLLGLGLVGSYAWRSYENTKQRPSAIPMITRDFPRAER